MSPDYAYQPLEKNTIRILQLQPGIQGSEIHFLLSEHSLADDEGYFALSYVWGRPDYAHTISSSLGSLAITSSLHDALQRYRDEHEPVKLWVDAVCINQADLDERASQILLMQSIYSRSRSVLVWLGKSSTSIDRAIEYITTTFNDLVPWLENYNNSTSEYRAALEELLSSLQIESYSRDISALFEKPWFLRAWTYQEIFSAPSAIITCGERSFDAVYLFNLASIWVRLVPRALWGSPIAIEAISQMSLCRYNQERYFERPEEYSFTDLISAVRVRQSQDPRDKVYCVIGLASHSPLPYSPSYMIETDRLYRDLAMQTILDSKKLAIFQHCMPIPSAEQLPSWVPDWRLRRKVPDAIDLHHRLFAASGSDRAEPYNSKDPNRLCLQGLLVDELTRLSSTNHLGVSRTWDKDEQRWASLFSEQYRIVKESADMTVESMRMQAKGQANNYWRAFICDQNDEGQRVFPIWKDRVRTYRRLLLESGGDWKKWATHGSADEEWMSTLEVEKRFVHVATGRRFCLTKAGRLGWVPQEADIGDVVSILFGSTVPVLLRPTGDGFKLIGQCYIHSIMDGEALSPNSTFRKRSIELV